ncbi:MAG: D-glycero-beta-D-manno-heptose-7-phosphate kinase [Candidatus Edwardsbacteria bacterium]
MHKITYSHLNPILSRFAKQNILVLGDVMLDEYLFGIVNRISPEAPVPVVEINRQTSHLGGAANVVWNITCLGGKSKLFGVIGDDGAGFHLLHELRKSKISYEGIVTEKKRPTTIKTRIIAHHQQVVRTDRETREEISAKTEEKLLNLLAQTIKDMDAVLIEDYNKGVLTKRVIEETINLCLKHKKIVTVDPKFNYFFDFKKVALFKPNLPETEAALGIKIKNDEDLPRAGKELLHRLKAQAVLITCGERGMTLFESEGRDKIIHIPTVAREVYDVSGAGDTVIATLTLALAAGADFKEAAYIANHAAGVEVGKIGVAAVSLKELRKALREW